MKEIVAGLVLSGWSDKDIIIKSATDLNLPTHYNMSYGLPKVLDQGALPMCSAVAASTNVEWATYMKTCEIQDLSERFIFDQRADKSLEGMTARDTFDIILKNGIPTTEAYKTKNENIIKQSASQHRIKYYGRLADWDHISPSILAYGPVYIALPVCNEDEHFWKNGQPYGYHAVVFTGWNPDGWVLRNSWGSWWADGGYTTFPYTDKQYIREAWCIINEK